MSFIGITGYERAGKDTVALLLAEYLGPNTNLIALADPIRELALALDPYIQIDSYGPTALGVKVTIDGTVSLASLIGAYGWEQAKDLFPPVRTFMQKLSNCRGIFGDDCYVNVAKKTIGATPYVSIVKDVRYKNEGIWCYDDSYALVRVDRPGFGPVNGHESASGQALPFADVAVANDGTIDDMRPQVKAIADNLMQSFGAHYRNKRIPKHVRQLCPYGGGFIQYV